MAVVREKERAVKGTSHLLSVLLGDCSEVLPSETADKAGKQMSRSFPSFCKQATKQLLSEAPEWPTIVGGWQKLAEGALLCWHDPCEGEESCQTAGKSSSLCWWQSSSCWAFFSKGYSPPLVPFLFLLLKWPLLGHPLGISFCPQQQYLCRSGV